MPSRVRRIRVSGKPASQLVVEGSADASATEFWGKYRQHIIAVVVAIALGSVVVLAFLGRASRTNQRALILIEDARSAVNSQTRIGILADVLERFPNSKPAFEAQYMLGNAYYDTDQFVLAKETFEQLIGKYPKSSYAPAAEEALGHIAEANGDLNEAAEHMKRVTEKYASNHVARRAYMDLGRLYEKLGETDKAADAYEALVSAYPASLYATDASVKLAELRPVEPQVDVDETSQPE